MTRAQHDAIIKLLPDLHATMAEEISGPVQDSIFRQLGLTGKQGGGDEHVLMAHAILYALYGFRPGRQTVAEGYAQRHAEAAQGELREYLSAIGGVRFSIHRALDPLPGQESQQVRLFDELDEPNEYVVWFDLLAELHKEKSVEGLLCAGYVVPIFGGHLHVSTLLTCSEEMLAEAVARKGALGRKASAQSELVKFVTRRALHEEMVLRDRAAERDE